MPVFHPSRKESVDGHVLDLDTAVKDGVLGGIEGKGVIGSVDEKLDLKKMIDELDLSEVPSVFICPISLEPMQDPVTLCTGQTYERSNIIKWFNLGRLTCPTTMQELWDETLTPNKTLHHLIYSWFSQKYLQMKKRAEDVQGRAVELIENLRKFKGQARIQALKDLRHLVAAHATARKAMSDHGGLAVVSSLLNRFTSHAVGSEVIGILVTLTLDSDSKSTLMQPEKISLMADILGEGSIETRINCTRVIETLMAEKGFQPELLASHALLVGLMRLAKDKRHSSGAFPALSLLKSIASHQQLRQLIVSINAVPQIVDLLPSLDGDCLEVALFVLDALSSVAEGKAALRNAQGTIPNMVRLLMRVSEACTRYALAILWCVCRLSPEECAAVAIEAGLAAKLLLVIQSGCDPTLKQQSSELLKLCSLNYSDSMFISKCKLTRTIQ